MIKHQSDVLIFILNHQGTLKYKFSNFHHHIVIWKSKAYFWISNSTQYFHLHSCIQLNKSMGNLSLFLVCSFQLYNKDLYMLSTFGWLTRSHYLINNEEIHTIVSQFAPNIFQLPLGLSNLAFLKLLQYFELKIYLHVFFSKFQKALWLFLQ